MFLPLTLVSVGDRSILAVECACGEPIERGMLVEFETAYMLCHEACLAALDDEAGTG
jgi:hypothetical protein